MLTVDFCTELHICCTTGTVAGHALEGGPCAPERNRAGWAAAKAQCRAGQTDCFLRKKKPETKNQSILFYELYFCFEAIAYYEISFNLI